MGKHLQGPSHDHPSSLFLSQHLLFCLWCCNDTANTAKSSKMPQTEPMSMTEYEKRGWNLCFPNVFVTGPGRRRIMRLFAVCEKWLLAIWAHPYRHCRAPVSWVGRFCLGRLSKQSSTLSCLFSHSMDFNPLQPQGLWFVP